MLCVFNKIPVFSSINFNSVERDTTISTALPSLSSPLTVFRSSISSLPAKRVTILDSSDIPPATPPTWKVRKVNCVPGQAEIMIAKHRNGSIENVRLKFIGHLGKFDNLDDYGSGYDDLPSSMNQDDNPFVTKNLPSEIGRASCRERV